MEMHFLGSSVFQIYRSLNDWQRGCEQLNGGRKNRLNYAWAPHRSSSPFSSRTMPGVVPRGFVVCGHSTYPHSHAAKISSCRVAWPRTHRVKLSYSPGGLIANDRRKIYVSNTPWLRCDGAAGLSLGPTTKRRHSPRW